MEMVYRRYIERIIGCAENLTSSKCQLSTGEKKEQMRRILANPRVKEALVYAKPKSSYMKLMLLPIRWGSCSLLYLESKVISRVKEKNGKLFAKLKAGR